MIFKNYRGVDKKNETVIQISALQGSKFKKAWQAQFLSHTLVNLGNDASFRDLQMIIVQFFHTSTILDITGLRSSSEKNSKPCNFEEICIF